MASIVDEGDWSYSLDLVQRLVESELDRVVRARYLHLAAMIARDKLDAPERATDLFDRAIEDDPTLFVAADELEATLDRAGEPLAAFYYRRLGHVKADEGRPGEKLRLWDRLAETCLALGRPEDAVVAFQVGMSLDPDNLERRQRLADLYGAADPKHDLEAIAHHQSLLAVDKRRTASYRALRVLYLRTGQHERAWAVEDALGFVGGREPGAEVAELFDGATPVPRPPTDPAARRPLANDDWTTLARKDVEPSLTALFAIVAPPFAAERARVRPPRDLPGRDVRDRELPTSITRALHQVITTFGVARPPIYVDRDQVVPSSLILRARAGVLGPVLVLGRPALDHSIADRELVFVLARQLADLRSDRIARLLCPRAGELAQIIELATAPDEPSKWLRTAVHPVEYDQVVAIGARLRERGVDAMRAARTWRTATERVADRVGLVVAGDLATCVRMLEGQATNVTSDMDRILDLVWSSVTEEVLGVRARVEGWRRRPGTTT
ncbi:MAG: tetratricopeptide repeat protein [Proteobacteria bacterium]|nr:tetratricopeptide repeat protein [Pseudomonadota bacterium]